MEERKRRKGRPRERSSRWKRPWIRALVLGGAVVVLTLHAAAFGAAALLLPRGFAVDDIHAWSDTWIPAAAALAITGVLARFVFLRSSALLVSLATAAIGGGWLAAVFAGHILFPISLGLERSIGPAAVAIALCTLAWATSMRILPSLAALLLGAGLGVVEVIAQRAPAPSTRPAGGTLVEVHGAPTEDVAASGQVSFPCGKEHVRVRPLLTFESRSPDATWTLLAPPEAFGPRRHFDAVVTEKTGFRAHYTDDGETTLVAIKDAKGLDITAVSKLPHPVYSRLNAFTTIHVPFEATLSFSPTGPESFRVEPKLERDSRPRQRAYLGADMAFHVVNAETEDGYREVARGHLGRDEALTIEIGHAGAGAPTPARGQASGGSCRLTFKNWASQVSTEPAPGLGSGIPQNSIQYSVQGKETVIVMTLAETGPGPTSRSVGHTEGTYENRIRVDTIMDAPRTK